MKNDFDGFLYYPNCLSFGGFTNLAAPALLGGYEYTPKAINERIDTLLKDKHNEALLVMPKLFSDANFNVTIADLPYANYKMYFDKEFYHKIPNINAFELDGKFGKKYLAEQAPELIADYDKVCNQRIKKFCIMEILYPPIRKKFYNNGHYYSCIKPGSDKYPENTINSYAELFYLSNLTTFASEKPTFTIFCNLLTHFDKTFSLHGSDYHIGKSNDEDENKTGSYNSDKDLAQITSYQTNAAAYILFSNWLKFLKQNNCYDNTRIIVVSDHGYYENFLPFRNFSEENLKEKSDRKGSFNPLLIIKDFDTHGEPKSIDDFITNAETLNFAIKNLPISNINPFTNQKFKTVKDFSSFEVASLKNGINLWQPTYWEDKKQFIDKNVWFWSVHDNIFDENNWSKIEMADIAK